LCFFLVRRVLCSCPPSPPCLFASLFFASLFALFFFAVFSLSAVFTVAFLFFPPLSFHSHLSLSTSTSTACGNYLFHLSIHHPYPPFFLPPSLHFIRIGRGSYMLKLPLRQLHFAPVAAATRPVESAVSFVPAPPASTSPSSAMMSTRGRRSGATAPWHDYSIGAA